MFTSRRGNSWKWRRRSAIEIWSEALKKDDPRHLVERYVEHYNNIRLNSAVGYITSEGRARWASGGEK